MIHMEEEFRHMILKILNLYILMVYGNGRIKIKLLKNKNNINIKSQNIIGDKNENFMA